MPDDGIRSMSGGSTIEITFGISERTSRVDLKKAMSTYGEVDVCHMGTRGLDNPFVRFRQQSCAEAALVALKNGEVFLEDGAMLAGEWKLGNNKYGGQGSENRRRDETEDMSSRNLIHGGKAPRSPSGSKRRKSKSRRRSQRLPSRSPSRSRSRSRGRRRSSRSRRRARRKEGGRHRRGRSEGSTDGPTTAPPPPALPAALPPLADAEQPPSVAITPVGDDGLGYSNPLFKRRRRAA